jgi:isocitrate dehydrogenase
MASKVPITVACGDGIGPEIMEAVLFILKESGAAIETEEVEVGEKVYLSGNTAGIPKEAWDSIRRTKVFLKAPITTPQGGGYKSLNVTTRKTLGLFANVRPVRAYHPFVPSKYPAMDLVIVRENEEDLYAGIEYRQTPDAVQAIKLITRPGCERIVRYAFEYAKSYGRRKVTCMTKDNIMKMSDGLFHKVFDEIGPEYPDIEKEHWIVDIGMAKMADTPEAFDVVVMPNLYGDIASDVVAQIAGSVGLAGSANVGAECAMFEAIHGSAPRRAGQGVANPSGLLQGAVMMLVHVGQGETAERIQNAWLCALEDGVHTYDLARGSGKEPVGTMDFARGIVARLGKTPQTLRAVRYGQAGRIRVKISAPSSPEKTLSGVDVFVQARSAADELGKKVEGLAGPEFSLVMIDNRGLKVYPGGFPESLCTEQWRCRFSPAKPGSKVSAESIRGLLARFEKAGLEWIKIENLYNFDGKEGYTLGQGQ